MSLNDGPRLELVETVQKHRYNLPLLLLAFLTALNVTLALLMRNDIPAL